MLYSQTKLSVIHEMIEKYPDAEARIWRGALIHHMGHVRLTGHHEGSVMSSNKKTWYRVALGKSCSCPDVAPKCKHQSALYLEARLA